MKRAESDEKFLADLSQCVRCGTCKARCPTYLNDVSEGMGARGRLVLIRGHAVGQLKPSPLLSERIFSCILCGACAGSCPLGIDIPEAIYRGRAILSSSDRQRRLLRSLVRFGARRPELSFHLGRIIRAVLSPLFFRKGLVPFLPELPRVPFYRNYHVLSVRKKKGRVAIFPGCSVNYLLPDLGESLINVLSSLGYEVVIPRGVECCAAPHRGLGLESEAVRLARKNVNILNRLTVESILSLCPTCTLTLKVEYPKMIGSGVDKVLDISEFFAERLGVLEKTGKVATYHDPCHLLYGMKVRNEPRRIIRNAGLELREPDHRECCGFGGTFCVSFPELSERLLGACAPPLSGTGADAVVTSCPGCMIQLGRTIGDRPVIHLIELIENAYAFSDTGEGGTKPDEGLQAAE